MICKRRTITCGARDGSSSSVERRKYRPIAFASTFTDAKAVDVQEAALNKTRPRLYPVQGTQLLGPRIPAGDGRCVHGWRVGCLGLVLVCH